MSDICFVVPVYKVPYELLQNCINSIINQTYKNIELILVDDGSPDDCGRICDKNAEIDGRISVIHKKNGGLSDARNAGINKCNSSWITFVDGDDWVDLDFAESFLNRLKNQKDYADFYIYNGYRDYIGKNVICKPYFDDGKSFITYEEREALQIECCMVPARNNGEQFFIGSGCAKVYRTEFLKRNNLFFTVVPYGEDSIFFFESVEIANKVEYVAKSVYHYRDTEGGMTNGYRKNADEEQDIYVEKIFGIADRYNKGQCFVDALYLRVFVSMQRCVSQKFFNKMNPDNLIKRWKECTRFFKKTPYKDIYKHINFSNLNRNSKLKYLFFKMKLYGLINISRSMYNRSKGKRAVERSEQ